MHRSALRWMWRRRWLTLCGFFSLVFIGVNVVAFNHAWSMTHFAAGGVRTPSPESLSFGQKLGVLCLGANIPRPANQNDPGSLGLVFETHKFFGKDRVELEGWRINRPDAKAMVLMVHGYASCKEQLLPEAKAFYYLGYATFLLDLRGGGGSGGNETTIGVDEAEDVESAVNHLQGNGLDCPLILYGQSMGSVAILRAISELGIRPDAVILECPFDRLISTVGNRFTAMGLPAFPFAQLLVFWGGVQNGFNGFQHNPAEYAKRVRCPLLLMHGQDDPRVTVQQASAIFQNIPADKEFKLLPSVGHESYVRATPELWTRTVERFLNSAKAR